MKTRLTVAQLEQMQVHELAELLANIVIVLRRLPNVPFVQLQPELATYDSSDIQQRETTLSTNAAEKSATSSLPIFTEAQLRSKKVAELKELVVTLHISTSAKTKAELISKILASQGQKHSEQFAIQNA